MPHAAWARPPRHNGQGLTNPEAALAGRLPLPGLGVHCTSPKRSAAYPGPAPLATPTHPHIHCSSLRARRPLSGTPLPPFSAFRRSAFLHRDPELGLGPPLCRGTDTHTCTHARTLMHAQVPTNREAALAGRVPGLLAFLCFRASVFLQRALRLNSKGICSGWGRIASEGKGEPSSFKDTSSCGCAADHPVVKSSGPAPACP